MPVYKDLKVKRGYSKTSHQDFWKFLLNVYQSMRKSLHFPKPPVDLAVFKQKIDKYWALCSATTGGAKVAFAQRDSLRYELNKMFLLLASYVEFQADGDSAVLDESGMEVQPSRRATPQPLERPRIPKAAHGDRSGEMKVWMPVSLRKIKACELRYTVVNDQDVPAGDWTEKPVGDFRGPVTITKLKPGKRYAFQVRAIGAAGKTDWSESLIKMCT
jgi:hypothetical protein